MLVKGVNHLSGEYQGHKYDRYDLYGLNERGNWEVVKVPSNVMQNAGVYDVNVLIENQIAILYNKYGRVEAVKIA